MTLPMPMAVGRSRARMRSRERIGRLAFFRFSIHIQGRAGRDEKDGNDSATIIVSCLIFAGGGA